MLIFILQGTLYHTYFFSELQLQLHKLLLLYYLKFFCMLRFKLSIFIAVALFQNSGLILACF